MFRGNILAIYGNTIAKILALSGILLQIFKSAAFRVSWRTDLFGDLLEISILRYTIPKDAERKTGGENKFRMCEMSMSKTSCGSL